MTTIIDKFNVIQNITIEVYYPLISNFLENYLEKELIILLPGYINQLIWDKKFDIDVIETICNEEIIKYLKNIKNNIKMLIKRAHSYSLPNGLNKIIDIYLNKIKYINNLFLFENKFINLFDTIVLSEPIIINFVKEEIYMKNKNEIKIFYNNLKKINFDMQRFMRLLKLSIIDNVPKIDYPIPDNLNSLYKLIIKLKYYDNLLNYYNFIIFFSLEELLLLIIDDIINIIEYFNFQEIKFVLKFLENNSDKFLRLKLNKLKKTLSNTIHVKYMLLDKNNIDNIEWENLVEIISLSNDLKLLEDYILSIINDESIQLTILNMVNKYNDIIIDKFFIVIHIKDKDVFFELYHQQLIKRLLSSTCDVKKDEQLALKLYVLIGPKISNKINKSIIDYKLSQDINSSFYKNNLIPIETIITSYNNWTFNCNQGYVESNNYLDNILNKFNIYFKYMNKGKKLIWFPQYGEINIKFNKMELIMLPIQFMVLELFDENDKININEIKIFENYSNVFKENVIKSLELTNIIERQDTFIILNETKKLRTTNFINIFYNLNMEEQVIEILNLREDAVKCWINKLLKLTPLSFNNLLNETNRNIVLFTVDTPLLEKVINKMIEMDYIELNSNNEYCKLLY